MQKSRLGIKTGAFGAAIYFTALFGGYLPLLLLTGYVLYFEENGWLRRTAVRAVTVMFFFSALSAGVGLVPKLLTVLDGLAGTFGGYVRVSALDSLASAAVGGIEIARILLLFAFGVKALGQAAVILPALERSVSGSME